MHRLQLLWLRWPVWQLLTSENWIVLNGLCRLVQSAQIDARLREPGLEVTCRLLGLCLERLDLSFWRSGSRDGKVEVLEEVPGIALARRLLQQTGQLVALGALALFGNAFPAIASRPRIEAMLCGACSTTDAYAIGILSYLHPRRWLDVLCFGRASVTHPRPLRAPCLGSASEHSSC